MFEALVRSNDPSARDAIEALEADLLGFYEANHSYYDAAASSDKSAFFEPVTAVLRAMLAARSQVRVLEVGAGKSDLPAYLQQSISPDRIAYVAHDINATNADFYASRGIELIVGPLSKIESQQIGRYDLVVSFFAYEHMTRPAECLDKMQALLRDDGRLIIVCPKYSFPFYIPPAIRHLRRSQQIKLNLFLCMSALLTEVTRRAKFFVTVDPAVLNAAWRRDADAVHMVSEADIEAHLGKEWSVKPLRVAYSSFRAALIGSLTLLSIVARRRTPRERRSPAL
jgi:SAM-dependent methyltransferase